MKVSLSQQMKLVGLTLAVATLSHQPHLAASAQQLSTTVSEAAQSTLVAVETGASFISGRGKTVVGGAHIVEEGGKRYLELDSDFRTDSGPDLLVLLHREGVPTSYADSDYVNLGQLQRVARTQRYEIPEGVDVSEFSSAVIWCREFNVTFGYATF
ncbi:MAG: DM13 domain-containing protein [Phormidesmis sp.]